MSGVGQPTHILSGSTDPGRGKHSMCGLLWINEHNKDRFVKPHLATCRNCRRGRSALIRTSRGEAGA